MRVHAEGRGAERSEAGEAGEAERSGVERSGAERGDPHRSSALAASHARPRNEVVDLDSRSGGYEDLPSTA